MSKRPPRQRCIIRHILLQQTQNANVPLVQVAKQEEKRLIIVLEGAHLESCKTGKDFSLLNIDEHRGLLSRWYFDL